jgi:hypothetical protein
MIREGVCVWVYVQKENLVSTNQKRSSCRGGYDFKEKESVYVYEGRLSVSYINK